MKAADISDDALLAAIRATRGRNGVPKWATIWDVQDELAPFHKKVVRAKVASAIRRGLIKGCTCGCRGDLEIPGEVASESDPD